MIRPRSLAAMPPVLSTSRLIRNTLCRFVAMTSYQSSSAMPAVGPPPLRPALLTRTSMGPKRSTACRTKRFTSSPSRTSQTAPSTSRPSSSSSLTVRVTPSSVRAHRNTR